MAIRSTPKKSALRAGGKNAARRAAGRKQVGIIMGSQSDWPTMKAAADMLEALGVGHETGIVSAHRTPDRMAAYAKEAEGRGIKVIIAGAGGAAHLPGMVASMTTLPVLGVPVQSRTLKGLDSLLSIAQMPGGVPLNSSSCPATLNISPAMVSSNSLFHADAPTTLSSCRNFSNSSDN